MQNSRAIPTQMLTDVEPKDDEEYEEEDDEEQ